MLISSSDVFCSDVLVSIHVDFLAASLLVTVKYLTAFLLIIFTRSNIHSLRFELLANSKITLHIFKRRIRDRNYF
jgi:hypothetical protein